jgi:hypothetical protein
MSPYVLRIPPKWVAITLQKTRQRKIPAMLDYLR